MGSVLASPYIDGVGRRVLATNERQLPRGYSYLVIFIFISFRLLCYQDYTYTDTTQKGGRRLESKCKNDKILQNI